MPATPENNTLLCPELPANTLSCLSSPPVKSIHETSPPHVPPRLSTPSFSSHGHNHHAEIINPMVGVNHYMHPRNQGFPTPNQGDIKRAASTGVTGADYPDRDFFPRASLTRSSTLTPSVNSFHSVHSETDMEGSESRFSSLSLNTLHMNGSGSGMPMSGDSANTTPRMHDVGSIRSDHDPVLVHPQASSNVSRTLFASESDPVINGMANSTTPSLHAGLLQRSASGHSQYSGGPVSNDSRTRSRTPIVGSELKMPPLSNGSYVSHPSPRFSPVGTPTSAHRTIDGSDSAGFGTPGDASTVPLGTNISHGLGKHRFELRRVLFFIFFIFGCVGGWEVVGVKGVGVCGVEESSCMCRIRRHGSVLRSRARLIAPLTYMTVVIPAAFLGFGTSGDASTIPLILFGLVSRISNEFFDPV